MPSSAATFGMLMSVNGIMIVVLELALIAWTQKFAPQPNADKTKLVGQILRYPVKN